MAQEVSKTDFEIEVVTRFCGWDAKNRTTRCCFVRLGDPNKGEPDVFICMDARSVAVELARYRELGSHNSKYHYDNSLIRAIFDAGLNDRSLSAYTPIFATAEMTRRIFSFRDQPNMRPLPPNFSVC